MLTIKQVKAKQNLGKVTAVHQFYLGSQINMILLKQTKTIC